jgi:hypothetical protein
MPYGSGGRSRSYSRSRSRSRSSSRNRSDKKQKKEKKKEKNIEKRNTTQKDTNNNASPISYINSPGFGLTMNQLMLWQILRSTYNHSSTDENNKSSTKENFDVLNQSIKNSSCSNDYDDLFECFKQNEQDINKTVLGESRDHFSRPDKCNSQFDVFKECCIKNDVSFENIWSSKET